MNAMTPNLVLCFDNQPVKYVFDLMKEEQVRRIIVLNDQNSLVGVVFLGDLAMECDSQFVGKVLEGVSEPL